MSSNYPPGVTGSEEQIVGRAEKHIVYCFACGKKMPQNRYLADTHEDQWVYVGPDCYGHIKKAGKAGYQPATGGPRLWVLTPARENYFQRKGIRLKSLSQVKS